MAQFDLEPDRFHEVSNKPLARRGTLWFIIGIGFTAAIVAWVVDKTVPGHWWVPLGIILPSALFGIGLAGMWPGFWFRDEKARTGSPPVRDGRDACPEAPEHVVERIRRR